VPVECASGDLVLGRVGSGRVVRWAAIGQVGSDAIGSGHWVTGSLGHWVTGSRGQRSGWVS
jgi:hypothetical protein